MAFKTAAKTSIESYTAVDRLLSVPSRCGRMFLQRLANAGFHFTGQFLFDTLDRLSLSRPLDEIYFPDERTQNTHFSDSIVLAAFTVINL
ncbi:hypothetical protein BRC91_04680 [Halobacteriales archaeon QS_4_62_28]|nr:MAG: hypothetical protein BRC91_04680 [Halobacteriales archaeon QS_4_62_28]